MNHGPFLVDNNVFLSTKFLSDWSQGGSYVHNLIAGKISIQLPQDRQTPFHKAHSTKIAGLHEIAASDSRFINNIFMHGNDLSSYNNFAETVIKQGNVFSGSKVRLLTQADGVFVEWNESFFDNQVRPLVTSALLGRTKVSDQPFEQADGKPLKIDTDYFGKPRNPANPTPGPFEKPGDVPVTLKVWIKN